MFVCLKSGRILLMTTSQIIKEIQTRFDVNAIFAHRAYSLSSKKKLFEDVARIIAEKPKPFIKWIGGKRQLLTQFRRLNLYPREIFDIKTGKYFELFLLYILKLYFIICIFYLNFLLLLLFYHYILFIFYNGYFFQFLCIP